MIKKILSLGLVISLVTLMFPISNSLPRESYNTNTWETPQRNSSLMSHVVAKGNGTSIPFLGTFFLGIGWCVGMVVLLGDNGYTEITPLDDLSNSTILEGSHQLFIVGFVGFRYNIPQININGIALLTLWS
jgi:hypothetical protein